MSKGELHFKMIQCPLKSSQIIKCDRKVQALLRKCLLGYSVFCCCWCWYVCCLAIHRAAMTGIWYACYDTKCYLIVCSNQISGVDILKCNIMDISTAV